MTGLRSYRVRPRIGARAHDRVEPPVGQDVVRPWPMLGVGLIRAERYPDLQAGEGPVAARKQQQWYPQPPECETVVQRRPPGRRGFVRVRQLENLNRVDLRKLAEFDLV